MDEIEGRSPQRGVLGEGRDGGAGGGVEGGIVTPRSSGADDVWAELTEGEDDAAPSSTRAGRSRSLTSRVFGGGLELPSIFRRSSAPDPPSGSGGGGGGGSGGGGGVGEMREGGFATAGAKGAAGKGGYAAVGSVDLEGGDDSPLPVDELLEGAGTGEWAAVSNLDEFFTRLYNYYREGGLVTLLLGRLSSLVVLAFTVVFSTFLFILVDWHALFSCSDAEDAAPCKELSRYIDADVLRFENVTTFQAIVVVYFSLFSLYWVMTALAFIPAVFGAWRMHVFYRDRLRITTRELQTMQWHEVVTRFEQLQRSGSYRVALKEVTAHSIAMRIMRKDNYMVALVNKDMLDLSLRVPCTSWRLHTPLTKSLEWNLDIALFSHMWGRNFRLRRNFVDNVGALQRRFVIVGIINALLLPFALMFLVVYFFLKHAEDFHKKGDYLGPRKWSPEAHWRFREFNELPHVFERRINASYRSANDFQKQFPFPELAALARMVAYIAGALVSALLLLTVIDENLLLFIHLGDRNLLWYIAMMSAVLAIARAFVPTPEESVFNPNGVMRKMVAFTHYMPRHWRGRCHTYDVRDEFLDLFQYRIMLFLQDIFSVIFTPLLLCFVLPHRAARLVDFINRVSTDVEGAGTVCGYSLFDINKYGNAHYGAPVHASKMLRSKQGKMEKSLVNFMTNHPNWEARPEMHDMLARLDDFQFEEAATALAAEAAAAAPEAASRSLRGSAVLRPVTLMESEHEGGGGSETKPNQAEGEELRSSGAAGHGHGDGRMSTSMASSARLGESSYHRGARLRRSAALAMPLSPGGSASERLPVLAGDTQSSQGRFFWLDVFYESHSRSRTGGEGGGGSASMHAPPGGHGGDV